MRVSADDAERTALYLFVNQLITSLSTAIQVDALYIVATANVTLAGNFHANELPANCSMAVSTSTSCAQDFTTVRGVARGCPVTHR
jgi:hypothetical protein